MSELIKQYIENPSQENKAKVIRYLRQHPMAECFATPSELRIIKLLK